MPTLLTLNAGSSSLRLASYAKASGKLQCVAAANYARDDTAPIELLERFSLANRLPPPEAIVHRVVHGGDTYAAPCRIDAAVEAGIAGLAPLAPLHNPAALELVAACRERYGASLTQVAVFDTAFFHDLPAVAARYALPGELSRQHGLRRYGFHGLAHQAMWQAWQRAQAQIPQPARIVTLQLGAGCSISAVRDGKPLDTSMGFTPLEGLVMATRSGDVDPGLLLHLQRQLGLDAAAIETLLSRESGLLGVSGVSGDMRKLLAHDTAEARLAIDLYCYRAAKYVGAYLTVLGGAEAIVFGGGVGENAPAIRARILQNLYWAGVHLDPTENQAALGKSRLISDASSPIAVWVLPVDEASVMAEQALALLDAS